MENNKFLTRKLEKGDYEIGFVECLNQLTTPCDISREDFESRFNLLQNKEDYHIYVIIDIEKNKVVAAGTLFVEYKFLRGCVKKAHIEDIVVDKNIRGCGLGKKIVTRLIKLSEELGCYKTALVCEKDNIPFYKKCGFSEKETEMVIYNMK
ncbi:putative glucosamine 6-phosphate N-acetyltransferase 2 [Nosema granulosis]|uniref:Glucosamine 6-phosphate N-acetyltransferase n=1 Tax=Nosema granulosis TaxID=83296 RepID=A0A9P6KZG5_9MICR|nr:putative glucosamine 6-phosphate N-acetyltransferase 2 [Nosema granulosis]